MALVADSFHMLSDIAALVIAFLSGTKEHVFYNNIKSKLLIFQKRLIFAYYLHIGSLHIDRS